MERAWSNSLLLAVLVLVPAGTAITSADQVAASFAPGSNFQGEVAVDWSKAAIVVGDSLGSFAFAGTGVVISALTYMSTRLETPVYDATESTPGRREPVATADLAMVDGFGESWGISVFEASRITLQSDEAEYVHNVAAGDRLAGSVAAPRIRASPTSTGAATVWSFDGAVNLTVAGPATVEIYGLEGGWASAGENGTYWSGTNATASIPLGTLYETRYISLTWNEGLLEFSTAAGTGRLSGNDMYVWTNGTMAFRGFMTEVPRTSFSEPQSYVLQAVGQAFLTEVRPSPRESQRASTGFRAELSAALVDGNWAEVAEQKVEALASAAIVVGIIVAGARYAFATALFTRLSPKEALEHPRRQTLLEYIQANPGATFRELCRATGIPAGTCRHHLSVLDRSQVIVEHRHRSTVRFFENHGKFDKSWQEVVMLRDPELERLHGWLRDHESTIQKDILEHALGEWGWSRSTTQHRLQRLVDNGLVQIHEMGRRKLYSLAQ